ncbi:MAG TPA: response regulator [Pyrinomonadaceae bacterium]|nr:response regulator [Pyrinomonadaceae bacterium]
MSENRASDVTVLVVDDAADNLVLVSLSLQGEGFRVLTATNGEEAIKVASLARPDLILMDIAMPELDGLSAARRIRQLPDLRHVPLVALTAFSTSGFQQAAYEAGFDAYLMKPLDFKRLNSLIGMLLHDGDTSDLSAETTELAREKVA